MIRVPRSAALLAMTASLLAADAQAAQLRTAVFAGGCFWSAEKAMETLPGVTNVVVGYTGGDSLNPTYRNHEGHLEAVKVTYDPAKTTYEALVDGFFHHIDPTDAGGQICDRGHSYTTAIFVTTEAQLQAAKQVKAQVSRTLGKPVATLVLRASPFWPAEAYHQDYAKRNPASYKAYSIGCGRDRALKAVWGSAYR